MNLPKFFEKFFNKKELKTEFFLIFLFNEDRIKAAVFKKDENKGEIVGLGEEKISGLDNWEEIIKKSDLLINKISKNTPQEKIEKVVFGLPSSFLEEGKIKDFYLQKLKKFSLDLLLKPVGFIVLTEALVKSISKKESSPLNGIILEIGEKEIYLTVSSNGKILGERKMEREEGVAFCEKIKESLENFSSPISSFPSRILLFFLKIEKEKYETFIREILSYPWTEKTKFLHFPKTELIGENDDLVSIIDVFASEIKINLVLEENSLLKMPSSWQNEGEISTEIDLASSQVEKTSSLEEPVIEEKKKNEEIKKENEIEAFGFIKDKDIKDFTPLGKEIPSDKKLTSSEEVNPVFEKETSDKKVDLTEERPLFLNIIFEDFRKKIKGIISNISSFNLLTKFKTSVFGLVLVILSLLFLGGVFYWYFPKGEVTFYLPLKNLEKEEEIRIQKNLEAPDIENRILPAREVIFEKNVQKKAKATGEKVVGEKARGEVIIYNKTNYSKKFPIGTVIYSPENIKFVFENEVTVSSQSSKLQSDESVVLTPGKAKVKVIAINIGAEGNLPKDTEFKIEDYSKDDFKAKNEDASFSGGTSRQVTVVSEKDQKKLLESLITETENSLKKEIEEGKNRDKFLKETLQKEIVSKKYSKEIDEEAEEFTLNLNLKFRIMAVKKEDFKSVIKGLIKKSLPKGYTFWEDDVLSEIKEVQLEEKNKEKIKIYLKVPLFPQIDEDKIRKILAGKNPDYTADYLKGILEISGYKVVLKPKLPGFFYTYPRRPENIKIFVKKI